MRLVCSGSLLRAAARAQYVQGRKEPVPAFAYGTFDQSDLDLAFDHCIDTVVVLFKDKRGPINGAVGQFKCRRPVLRAAIVRISRACRFPQMTGKKPLRIK